MKLGLHLLKLLFQSGISGTLSTDRLLQQDVQFSYLPAISCCMLQDVQLRGFVVDGEIWNRGLEKVEVVAEVYSPLPLHRVVEVAVIPDLLQLIGSLFVSP